MAKKQTMNFFEANVEKIVIAIAVLFLGWVLYSSILNAPGVNNGSDVVSGVDAANEAKDKARNVVQNMSRPAPTDELAKYQPVGNLLELVEPVEIQEIALVPPDMTRIIKEQDVRNYVIPELPALTDVKMKFTKTMGYVPVDGPVENVAAGAFDPRMQNTVGTNMALQDVRFVSVEATVNLEDLYEKFTSAFTGPQVNKPMTELYTPIIATVDLLRSEMKEDGSWTEEISVPRAKIDPLRNTLNANDFRRISKARHSVAMRDNSTDQVQLMLLQPAAYELIDGPWKNPSSTENTEDNRRAAQPRDPRAGQDPRDPRAGGMVDPRLGGGLTTTSDLKVKDLKFWAHDDTVVPGKLYKYSIRLGFFNPCYETNWVVDAQADMKYQPILWTKTVSPRDTVQIPPVVMFVPRAIADSENARIEIYKYQNGQWFKRPFTISPGSQIGSVFKMPAIDPTQLGGNQPAAGRGGMATEQNSQLTELDVDFSMNATVLEIKAPAPKTYEVNGQTVTDISGEIVYRDADGNVKTIDSNNAFWSETYRQMLNDVNRAFNTDERTRRDLARNRPR